MKFTLAFVIVAVTTMTRFSPVFAAPQNNESPAFPDSQCAVAVEFDLPETSDSAIRERQLIGPPDFWCCDGYAGDYHSGAGKRVCCPVNAPCCNVVEGSVWRIAGHIKSLMPVGEPSTFLKSGRNCGGSCLQCSFLPTMGKFPGWASIKKGSC